MECDGCDYTHYKAISEFYQRDDLAVDFFRRHGVLHQEMMCPTCNRPCTYVPSKNYWKCFEKVIVRKQKKKMCTFSVSDRANTFLQDVRLPESKVILFVNAFLDKFFHVTHVMKHLEITAHTAVDWRSFCSEVTISGSTTNHQLVELTWKLKSTKQPLAKGNMKEGVL